MIFRNKWLILQIISALIAIILFNAYYYHDFSSIFIYLSFATISILGYFGDINKKQIPSKKIKIFILGQHLLIFILVTTSLFFGLPTIKNNQSILSDSIISFLFVIYVVITIAIFTLDHKIKKML